MYKKNKNWIIVIIIIILIYLIINNINIKNFNKDNIKSDLVTNSINSDIQEEFNVELDSYELVKENPYKNDKDFLECVEDNIDKKSCLEQSIKNDIRSVSDLSKCDVLNNEFDINDCKKFNIKNIAEKNKDISLCSKTGDLSDNCEYTISLDLAIENKDFSKCNRIKEKEACINTTAAFIARRSGDKKWCEKISDKNAKNNCIIEVEYIKENGDKDM